MNWRTEFKKSRKQLSSHKNSMIDLQYDKTNNKQYTLTPIYLLEVLQQRRIKV